MTAGSLVLLLTHSPTIFLLDWVDTNDYRRGLSPKSSCMENDQYHYFNKPCKTVMNLIVQSQNQRTIHCNDEDKEKSKDGLIVYQESITQTAINGASVTLQGRYNYFMGKLRHGEMKNLGLNHPSGTNSQESNKEKGSTSQTFTQFIPKGCWV